MSKGWIGVDLDGTLAHYDRWYGIDYIGKPIKPMVERVKKWIAEGVTVKIFTARVSDTRVAPRVCQVIAWWLKDNGLPDLEVTNVKDLGMVQLWDDRAVQVVPNTGEPVGELLETLGN